MYVIVVYDMEADRTYKMLKLCRQYLTHVQNSVLEGEITEGDLKRLEAEIEGLLKEDESTIIYRVASKKWVDRSVYGEDPTDESRFL